LDNSIAVQCPKAGERDSKSCWLRSIRRGCANFFGGIFGKSLPQGHAERTPKSIIIGGGNEGWIDKPERPDPPPTLFAHYTCRLYRAEVLQERLESRLELLGRDWVGICPFKRDTFKRTYPFKEATANIKQIC